MKRAIRYVRTNRSTLNVKKLPELIKSFPTFSGNELKRSLKSTGQFKTGQINAKMRYGWNELIKKLHFKK